jgi:hypothetical protein
MVKALHQAGIGVVLDVVYSTPVKAITGDLSIATRASMRQLLHDVVRPHESLRQLLRHRQHP